MNIAPVTPADWAAWTQALAAILALIVAVGVPIWQRAKEQERRTEDESDRKARENEKDRQRTARAYGLANLFAVLLDELLENRERQMTGLDEQRRDRAAVYTDLLNWGARIDLVDMMPKSAEAFIRVRSIAIEAIGCLQSSSDAPTACAFFDSLRANLRLSWKAVNDAAPPGVIPSTQATALRPIAAKPSAPS